MDGFFLEDSKDLEIQNVYDHLQDQESKEIYLARSRYSLTGDRNYLRNVIRNMAVAKTVIGMAASLQDREIILFGLGEWGKAILDFFPELYFDAFVDNKKAGQMWNGKKVITLSEAKEFNTPFFIVSIYFDYDEVKRQLYDAGYCDNDFIILGEETEKYQYFDLAELNFGKNESFLDVGGYDGGTSVAFSEITQKQYYHIFCMEPILDNQKKILERTRELREFTLVKKGASDKKEKLYFDNLGEASRVATSANEKLNQVETDKIDSIFKNEKITYIKMDIEGMEFKALNGAKKIITEQKPKLAISIYHRRRDIWEIPALLLRMNPDYKFYIRLYSFKGNEVVLYAL